MPLGYNPEMTKRNPNGSTQVMPGHSASTIGGVLENYPIHPGTGGIVVVTYNSKKKKASMAHIGADDNLDTVEGIINQDDDNKALIFARTHRNEKLKEIEEIIKGTVIPMNGYSIVAINAATGKFSFY